MAGPATFGAIHEPGRGALGIATVSTIRRGVLPVDRHLASPMQGYAVPNQRGPILPPIRDESPHEDTQLPGIHQMVNLPMAHREVASVQRRKPQQEPFQTAETLFVDDRSKRTRKRRRESFESQDALEKDDPVCPSTPAILDHTSLSQDRTQPDDMAPPAPKRKYGLASGMFGIPCRSQSGSPPTQVPTEEPTQPLTSPAPRLGSRHSADSQATLIVKLASSPDYLITQRAHDVFNKQQCERILWLALHGVSSAAIARQVYLDIKKPKPNSIPKADVVAGTDKLVQLFIAELATGEDGTGEVDDLLEYLLQQGDRLNWSPSILRQAAGFMSISGDEATQDQELRENAAERQALSKWRCQHGGQNPVEPAYGIGRRPQMLAFRGLMREQVEQEMMEQLGYREGSHTVERELMKKWLLKIRELGKLPDRLVEAEVGAPEETDMSGDCA
ncbi:uncharacterized protein PV07_10463 [Cladophialophora immunda]|uniref:Uncharacterized protein n=1 Tax=Cladophialophora immunda TaxID=569365 RepID=A0A0D2C2P1_9EURO|nr:uncharacterized protein PV07_10463 [Cladophialophora immunda]KIW24770.1 hypothetical protein PV07_10463 [Cladophialophora immunda]